MDKNIKIDKKKPPTTTQYAKAKKYLITCYCPRIYPCQHCKWPVVEGYCCQYCGSNEPR